MTDASNLPGASTGQRAMSRMLRQRAQEFLASRKHANNLVEIISHWDVSRAAPMSGLRVSWRLKLENETDLKFRIRKNCFYLQDSTCSCLLTIETIFVEVLKRGDMYMERTIALTISGKIEWCLLA